MSKGNLLFLLDHKFLQEDQIHCNKQQEASFDTLQVENMNHLTLFLLNKLLHNLKKEFDFLHNKNNHLHRFLTK